MTAEKKPVKNPVLKSWNALNDYLRDCELKDAEKLLEEEKAGRARKMFLKRIHARLNKVRAETERAELEAVAR